MMSASRPCCKVTPARQTDLDTVSNIQPGLVHRDGAAHDMQEGAAILRQLELDSLCFVEQPTVDARILVDDH